LLIVARACQGATGALMTPQVLSIIQAQFADERRARAIGAYSLIPAVGVAVGQVIGGLLVGAHLLGAAWRPALLLNAPVGAVLLVGLLYTASLVGAVLGTAGSVGIYLSAAPDGSARALALTTVALAGALVVTAAARCERSSRDSVVGAVGPTRGSGGRFARQRGVSSTTLPKRRVWWTLCGPQPDRIPFLYARSSTAPSQR
jgi:MFS family permease